MRDADVNMEPLPGYRRTGAGGYGEVWRAEAPGGLTMAIIFVFGQRHETRATNELQALEHIRSVRHPFLLSLERIEVVDDRLLVVLELANNSVKDRFDQCRRENMCGIPRDELISYKRDTADALDFMSSTHALQHLDIKPENLLLLAGRVRFAWRQIVCRCPTWLWTLWSDGENESTSPRACTRAAILHGRRLFRRKRRLPRPSGATSRSETIHSKQP